MCDRTQLEEGDWAATLSLWREAIPDGLTSEDSIRSSHETPTEVGAIQPRFRALERDGASGPDFELGAPLGAGGMGVVYAARQTALGRDVAVKMVKPGRAGSADAADALMAEAVVTGRLEHPNVVPVYDLGIDADGNLFYAMKEVRGTPWSELLGDRALDENLDVLSRVADTIAFAHARGVLHRDLKPQNIMLGEFGEVMVVDWGASRALAVAEESGCCGTPAYMPPEMARGDFIRVGEASDVYLLGAMLYQILTGHPPRTERDPVLCLNLASENHVEPIEGEDELARIALKAMASAPADRYPTARAFQDALRAYRSHSESLIVMANAKANLGRAKERRDYDLFSRAIHGFRESLDLWPGNPDAERLRREAAGEYARNAFENNDLELARSLLDADDPAHRQLLDLITGAIADRDARKRRNRRLLFTARALWVVLSLLFVIAFIWIRSEQKRTAAEHRKSLISLIVAYFGENNHEATEAAFWRLQEQYGIDGLNSDTLLNTRIAAAMNPWMGALDSGVEQPHGFVPSRVPGCVWVVGENGAARVKPHTQGAVERGETVAIHDFRFAQKQVAGVVEDHVVPPGPIARREAFFERPNGELWVGCGSIVYTRAPGATEWVPQVDLSEMEFPPLPAAFSVNEAEKRKRLEWMNTEGRRLPISAVHPNGDGTQVAVALGGSVICWVDVAARQVLGWYFGGFGNYLEPDEFAGHPSIRVTEDERFVIFREGGRFSSFCFLLEAPTLKWKAYFYARDYPVHGIAVSGTNLLRGITAYGSVFSPRLDQLEEFGPLIVEEEHVDRWDPESYTSRTFDLKGLTAADLTANGERYCFISENQHLAAGPTTENGDFEFSCAIVERDYQDCHALGDERALLLEKDGRVHLYDVATHAIGEIALDSPVLDVDADADPGTVFALTASEKDNVVRIGAVGAASPKVDPRFSWPKQHALAVDPLGRFLVVARKRVMTVYDAASGERVFRAPVGWHSDFDIVHFSDDGAYLLAGRDWSHECHLFRVDSWSEVAAFKEQGYLESRVDFVGGAPQAVIAKGWYLTALSWDAELTAFSETNWHARAEGTILDVLPTNSTDDDPPSYWCRLWFDRFVSYDAASGALLPLKNNHWVKTSMQEVVGHPGVDYIALLMMDGDLNIGLRSDLYPIFDPRALPVSAEDVTLSSDGRVLFILSDGRLFRMKMSAPTD